jgi:hypothetical protein
LDLKIKLGKIMKSIITTTLALFFFLLAGTASAATDFSADGFKSIQSDMICAEEKKKKNEGEEEEPECD